jgi:hypothetical protein
VGIAEVGGWRLLLRRRLLLGGRPECVECCPGFSGLGDRWWNSESNRLLRAHLVTSSMAGATCLLMCVRTIYFYLLLLILSNPVIHERLGKQKTPRVSTWCFLFFAVVCFVSFFI